MNNQNYLIGLFFLLLSTSVVGQNNGETYRSEYYAQLPFWESPYQPFIGAIPITKEIASNRIHLKIDFDDQNRITAAHVRLGKHYKEYEGRFGNLYINAPLTKVSYKAKKETHRFFDRFGNQINVQGNVYTKVYHKDEYGRNIKLTFLNKQGEETLDQTSVKSYNWTHQNDGSIVEERLGKDNSIVPLRGIFHLMRTRMVFDNQGRFKMLQNIDDKGNIINTDKGVAIYKYYYDNQGRFLRWEVYDKDGEKAIGPSNTAGELVTFYEYNIEGIIFFDVKENPAIHWSGAQRWHYELDDYGNRISLEFQTADGKPMDANNGFSKNTWEWSKDGRYLLSAAFFDSKGNKIIHKAIGVHKAEYIRNNNGLIITKKYLDINGNLANRIDSGAAMEKITYDDNNLKRESLFYDKNGKEINTIKS